jgi:cell division protein FtsI (penicillin-binding protein 3)
MALVDRRIGLLFGGFVLLLMIALGRAAYLGLIDAGSLQQHAAAQQVSTVAIPAQRGTITDRHGTVLALSEAADEISADPYLIEGDRNRTPGQAAALLAPLLGQPRAQVLAELTKPRTGFVYLAYDLPAARGTQIANLRINGIGVKAVEQRVYPRSWSAAQVLGWVGSSGAGLGGIEYEYNSALRGQGGTRKVVSDAVGQPISIDQVKPMVPGKSIQLTIDAPLQDEVEQVLAGVGATYSPKSATAIVMDPQTSQILALANWPRVNANNIGASPLWATEDWATGLSYEPGSTFKAVTVAGALQEGLVTPSTEIPVPSVLQVADRTIHDAEVHGNETLTVAQVLKYSSNIGADEIGMRIGATRFSQWVTRFGFGAPTGVDLPGEQPGIILPLSRYSGSTMGNLPFGQGESVTPMQMITAYSAIANGGILRPPRIVQSIGGKPVPEAKGVQIISPQTASELRDMLRGVYGEGGTASGAGIPGYDLAGKTGTANIAVHGVYSSTEYVASFIGMVPASDPKLVVAVVVDQPHGSIYGGSVAAPAFQKIVGWAVPYLGINPCPNPCPASARNAPTTPAG